MRISPKDIKQGDLRPSLRVSIPAAEVDGATSVDIILRSAKGGLVLPAQPTDSPDIWEHRWIEGETDIVSRYKLEVTATWVDGSERTWPQRDFVSFHITPDLDLADVPSIVLPQEPSFPVRSTGDPQDGDALYWDADENLWRTRPAPVDGDKGDKGDPGERGEKGNPGAKGDPGTPADTSQFYTKAQTYSRQESDQGLQSALTQAGVEVTAEIQAAIATLIDSAPGTLDTLREIAEQLAADQTAAAALSQAVAALQTGKVDKADVYTKAQTFTKDETAQNIVYWDDTVVKPREALKADKSDTYTKADVDNKDALKADRSDTYTKLQTDQAVGTRTTPATVDSKIQTAINALVNAAPGTLDTLGEIAAQLAQDESAVSALTTVVTALQNDKANKTDVYTKTQSDAAYSTKSELTAAVSEARLRSAAASPLLWFDDFERSTLNPTPQNANYQVIDGVGTGAISDGRFVSDGNCYLNKSFANRRIDAIAGEFSMVEVRPEKAGSGDDLGGGALILTTGYPFNAANDTFIHLTYRQSKYNLTFWSPGNANTPLESGDGFVAFPTPMATDGRKHVLAMSFDGDECTVRIGPYTFTHTDSRFQTVVGQPGCSVVWQTGDNANNRYRLRWDSAAVVGARGTDLVARKALTTKASKPKRVYISDANYACDGSEDVLIFSSLTAARTVTLPDATTYGAARRLLVKNRTSSIAPITFARLGTDTIEGAATYTWSVAVANMSIELVSDGTGWVVVSKAENPAVANRVNGTSSAGAIAHHALAQGAQAFAIMQRDVNGRSKAVAGASDLDIINFDQYSALRDYGNRLGDGQNVVHPGEATRGYASPYTVPVSNFLFMWKFSVRKAISVSKVFYSVGYPATNDDRIAWHVFKYDPTATAASQIQKVASTGPKTGILNVSSNTSKIVDLASAVTLQPGTIYYMGISLPAFEWNGTSSTSTKHQPWVSVNMPSERYASPTFPMNYAYVQFAQDAAGSALCLTPENSFNPNIMVNWVYPFDLALVT